jgi:hypothetical protein
MVIAQLFVITTAQFCVDNSCVVGESTDNGTFECRTRAVCHLRPPYTFVHADVPERKRGRCVGTGQADGSPQKALPANCTRVNEMFVQRLCG